MSLSEFKQFVELVRDGMGFIFSEDVKKYYEEQFMDIDEGGLEDLQDLLREHNLIKE